MNLIYYAGLFHSRALNLLIYNKKAKDDKNHVTDYFAVSQILVFYFLEMNFCDKTL